MMLHDKAFEYLAPTDEQFRILEQTRAAFERLAGYLDNILPDGPDKTYMMRKLRECAMWSTQTVLRNPDGSPRT